MLPQTRARPCRMPIPVTGRSFLQFERLGRRSRICDEPPVGEDVHPGSVDEELSAFDALAYESGRLGYRLGRGIVDAVPEFQSFERARPEPPIRDGRRRLGHQSAAAVRAVQPVREPAGAVP